MFSGLKQACLKKLNCNPISSKTGIILTAADVSYPFSDQDSFCFGHQNPVGFIGGKAQDVPDDVDGTD